MATPTPLARIARHLITVNDDKHAEWVLFRHGSLYIQTMPDNLETPEDELIGKAKESLSGVLIQPGSSYGDSTTYTYNYENQVIYCCTVDTFRGIILVQPSEEIDRNILAMLHSRTNVLNDQKDPVVVTTGNTKQDLEI